MPTEPKIRDYVIRVADGNHWPGILPFRGPVSRRGYKTEEDAHARLRRVAAHYAAKGTPGWPDLRVVPRYAPEAS